MKRGAVSTQLLVLGGVAALFALGAVQGARLDRMRELERAYRWTVTAASFAAFGESLEGQKEGGAEPLDDEIFAKLVALGEEALPDVPVEPQDVDSDGETHPALVRAVRQGLDHPVYAMLAGPRGHEIVNEFLEAAKSSRIASIGTQFTTASLYDPLGHTEGVGLSSLFFGLRKVAANFLWMQVDGFWHSGQMHRMVPAMRTTVALDPNFIDAYLLGAWHLAYNLTAHLADTPEPQKVFNPKYGRRLGAKEEWYYIAADFLKDGIRKNPRSYQLYFDLGYAVYENKLDDHPNAVLYLTEARRYKHDRWVPRMLYLAMWRNGQYEDAIQGWIEYLEVDPSNVSAQRFLQINRAYLAEAKSDQAADCAKAARAAADEFRTQLAQAQSTGNESLAAEAQAKIDQAERVAAEMDATSAAEWGNAQEIYLPMIRTVDDSIAKARVLRHTALDFARQGRHLEAVMQLDLARYEMLESFDELSDLRIRIKQEGGLPLEVTEQLAIERQREAAQYADPRHAPPRRYIECVYSHDEADA